jgi:hypothetical protein
MDTTIDKAFIQEPYTYHNKVTGISRKYRIFACGNGRKRAVVVVVNKQIDALLISQLSEEDTVVVQIMQCNLKFIAASIYLDINNEITMDLYKIENILQFAKGRGLLVAMDSNARSKKRHDVITNKRGRKLKEFVVSNNIHIVNYDSKLATEVPASNVDLTIADNKMATVLNTRQCNEQELFSDHRIITFSIEKSKDIINGFNLHCIKYITSEESFKTFDDNFITEIKNNFNISEIENLDNILNVLVTSETDIERFVEKYQDSIIAASKRSFKVRRLSKTTTGNKSVPWWTRELTVQRGKLNAVRRRYSSRSCRNALSKKC